MLTSEQLDRRVGKGWRFIALASDVAFMMGGAKRTLEESGVELGGKAEIRY